MDKNKSFSITRYAFQSFRHYGGKSMIFMIALAVTLVLSLLNIMTSLEKTIQEHYSGIYGQLDQLDNGNKIFLYALIVFFMLVGTLIIYNAFNIIIAKRTRHFGLLTLIGASKKQIRKCVYIEALLNTVTALPVGLILGTLASWIFMPVVESSYAQDFMIFYVTPLSYILTAATTIIMVFAGAVMPAVHAGKITPVEAAKFAPNDIKPGKKQEKINIVENINLPALARINLFRRKDGAKGTVVSLSVVGILFIGLAFILFSVYGSLGNLIRQSYAADITVRPGYKDGSSYIFRGTPVLLPNIVEKIINLDGVKKSHVFYGQDYARLDEDPNYSNNSIIGADDELIKEFLNQLSDGSASFDDLKTNILNVLVANVNYMTQEDKDKYNYKTGDDVTVNLYNKGNYAGQITFHVVGIAENFGGYITGWGGRPVFIMPQSSFEANGFTMQCDSICLNIDDSKYNSIVKNLAEICEEEQNIHYISSVEERKQYENQMMSIIALVMTGLGIVFAVSILNLISTTFIGIEQRKKEFGVLSALGMSRRDLKKMLNREGIWIAALSTAISIAGGFGIGFAFYKWIDTLPADNYIELSFPVIPVVIFIFTYIFVPYIISNTAVRRLLKNTTVELIGKEI